MAWTTEANSSPVMPCTGWAFHAFTSSPNWRSQSGNALRQSGCEEQNFASWSRARWALTAYRPKKGTSIAVPAARMSVRTEARMELQVDLRGRGAVGASDHVELPVAERRPHRVQVVHRHPRPVLRHVGVVRFRSPGPSLVDEQDVVIHAQQRQLLAPVGRLVGGGVSRSAGEIRDRVRSDGLRERRQDDDVEPDRAPVRLRAVLRDDEGAAAGVDPLHHARLWRPRYRAWPEKNARSMPTPMPAAATRPTRDHTTHRCSQ